MKRITILAVACVVAIGIGSVQAAEPTFTAQFEQPTPQYGFTFTHEGTLIFHELGSRIVIDPMFRVVSVTCDECGDPCPDATRTIHVNLEANFPVPAGYGASDLVDGNYSVTDVNLSTTAALAVDDPLTIDITGEVFDCLHPWISVYFSICHQDPGTWTDHCSVGTPIAGTSFEEPGTGAQYVDTGDAGVDHDLVNNAGEAPVDYTAVATELGFDSWYYNTRDGVGLTDGDWVGVTSYTGVVGAYTDGVQGFQMSDCDGKMVVTLDTVDLSGATGVPWVSLDFFVQATGWESNDLIKIWVDGDVADITLLDSTGLDIDDLAIEGAWYTPMAPLGANTTAALVVELDSNSGDEALFIDNVRFTDE